MKLITEFGNFRSKKLNFDIPNYGIYERDCPYDHNPLIRCKEDQVNIIMYALIHRDEIEKSISTLSEHCVFGE